MSFIRMVRYCYCFFRFSFVLSTSNNHFPSFRRIFFSLGKCRKRETYDFLAMQYPDLFILNAIFTMFPFFLGETKAHFGLPLDRPTMLCASLRNYGIASIKSISTIVNHPCSCFQSFYTEPDFSERSRGMRSMIKVHHPSNFDWNFGLKVVLVNAYPEKRHISSPSAFLMPT